MRLTLCLLPPDVTLPTVLTAEARELFVPLSTEDILFKTFLISKVKCTNSMVFSLLLKLSSFSAALRKTIPQTWAIIIKRHFNVSPDFRDH